MLNKQEPLPRTLDPSGWLTIHSIFRTIQGEGIYAGHRAVFVRLFGCNLQCPWCDTDYTSVQMYLPPSAVLAHLAQEYADHSNLVVITGGEPFRQSITPVVKLLLEAGWRVQIETNGTLAPGDDFPWEDADVICSPKTPKIHPKVRDRVRAYKYVLSHDSVAPDGLPGKALGHPLGKATEVARPPEGWVGPVYLQPMDAQEPSENEANMAAVVSSCMEHGHIMGVQMHKIMGLP